MRILGGSGSSSVHMVKHSWIGATRNLFSLPSYRSWSWSRNAQRDARIRSASFPHRQGAPFTLFSGCALEGSYPTTSSSAPHLVQPGKHEKSLMREDDVQALYRVIRGNAIPSPLRVMCRTTPLVTEDPSSAGIDWIDISCTGESYVSPMEWDRALHSFLAALGVPTEERALPSQYLLPHATVMDGCHLLLLRLGNKYDTSSKQLSTQNLTNRLAIYVMQKPLEEGLGVEPPPVPKDEPPTPPDNCRTIFITVHRTIFYCVQELQQQWSMMVKRREVVSELILFFSNRVLGSFTHNLQKCLIDFDSLEAAVFRRNIDREALTHRIYGIKRRLAVFERCLSLSQEAFAHTMTSLRLGSNSRRYVELQRQFSNAEGLARDLSTDADAALQLVYQMSSFQVNELMRFLTLFSTLFIPLNFISSLYGMNVSGLPFMDTAEGHIYLATIFASVFVLLLAWFRRRKLW